MGAPPSALGDGLCIIGACAFLIGCRWLQGDARPAAGRRNTVQETGYGMNALWPLGLYIALVVVIVGAMLGLSYILGERHQENFTGIPYEGGIKPEGSARVRFSLKFYLVAVFFVIFDLESVFLITYAVAARPLGWMGYAEAMVFIAILLAALAYLWRLGALDWGPMTGWRSRSS